MIILERPSRGRSLSAGAGKLVPEPADAYVLWQTLLASGALLIGWSQRPVHHPGELLFFALLAAVAGSQKLWVPDSARSRISVGYIFVMVGLLFLGVPEAMLIAAASGLTGSLLNVPERPSLRESAFNVSAQILSAALAGGTLLVLGGTGEGPLMRAGILPIFAAAGIYFLTNSGLAALAVSLTDRRPMWGVWRQGLLWTVSGAVAGSSLAMLMARAYELPDRTLFYLSLPLAYVMFAAYQATLERMDESRRHVEDLDRTARELYASFQRVGQALAAPLDTGALHRLIVELCHEMLAPQMSGLCLWRDGALQLMAAQFSSSFPSGRNGSVADAVQKASATALERGHPTSTPTDGVRPGATGALAFAVPLRSPEVVHGALCVLYDPSCRLTDARRQLLTTFAAQAALALQNARLFQREQDVADTMRRSLLPLPRIEAPHLEIGTIYEPLIIDAGCIGGDYYDVFTLDDGRVAVSIADVCGKGISAAVRTALSKYTVRAYAVETPTPHPVLAHANAAFIAQESDPETFTTLAYALLDAEEGSLSFSAAGHPPALLYRAATRRYVSLDAGGAALGVLPGAEYEEVVEAFGPNDVLLLYTDGVLEARRGSEEFGLERLGDVFVRVAARAAQEIADAVVEAAREFAGGAFADDVTLLVLKNTRPRTGGAGQ
jgi:serine phosphatase RsbU (regulator of sigma subunit)